MGVKPIKDKQALTADGEKALPTAAANNVKNLSVGSTGADVVKLQKALGIDADGIFGPQTQQAVINYQKANGLDPDGIAGELTLGKLYGTTANNTVPPVASNPPVAQPPVANPPTAKPPAANPPAAQPEPEAPATSAPEAPSKTVTSPAGFTYGDFQYDAWNPQNDPTIQQANTLLQEWLAGKPGDYTPKWQDEADAYLSQYQDRDPFSYDFNSDALYNQYKDQYIQQGRMAMMDTMGQAAALTGGYGNSYAQTVGQQAYNQQLGQLNEIMPELYGMAYDQYTQEGKDMLAMYDLYMGREDQEYGRYQDDLNNWYNQLDYLTQRYDTAYDRGYDDYLRGYNSARSEYDTDRSEAFSKWQMEQDQKFTADENEKNRKFTASDNAKSGNAKNTMPLADQRQYENDAKKAIEESGIDGLYDVGARMEREGYSDSFITSWIEEQIKKHFPNLGNGQPPKKVTPTGGGRSGLGTVYNEIM